ncbi:MAG: DUF302 domain-containing protein [Anaerolineales bacterium]|nr:DUF302 domain-containing protein [Anaerolineales bacterium]
MEQPLGFDVRLAMPLPQAVEVVTEALKQEGFGVLTRIDVQATLREKMGKEFRPYVILGACNPPLAHCALDNDPRVGLLLPCNVVVDERSDGVWVSIVNPEVLLAVGPLAHNAPLCSVASEARVRLERVAAALQAAG